MLQANKALCAILFMFPTLVIAQEKGPSVGSKEMATSAEKIAKQLYERSAAAIEELKSEAAGLDAKLQRLQRARINRTLKKTVIPDDEKKPILFPSVDAKNQEVAIAERNLAKVNRAIEQLRGNSALDYGVLKYPPKIGDFGKLQSGKPGVNVVQVQSESSMLVDVYYIVPTVRRVGNTFVNDAKAGQIMLMVKNVPTKGATDGNGFDLPQVFEVVGTNTYPTVDGGTNTVFVVEPLDTDAVEKHLKELQL